MEKLNIIIFSKDRACQLDLLLRSIEKHVSDRAQIRFSVLYTASDRDFDLGYEQIKNTFPEFHFYDERDEPGDFKSQTLHLADTKIPYLMFMVDDDVFKNPFSLSDRAFRAFERSRNHVCLSLRLGRHISHCYPLDIPTPPPRFSPGWVWRWKGLKGDWGYPMSLDGHIFRTTKLVPLLKSIPILNPNRLEGQLATHPLRQPKMSCYEYSLVMNLPVNRVQDINDNRSGDVDPTILNDRFVKEGRRIRLEPFDGFVNVSPHQELPLEFTESR